MTYEEREKYLDKLVELTREVMTSKGREYAASDDCNANFKRMGGWLAMRPELYAFTMVSKHLDWLHNYLQTKNEGVEGLDERIKDIFAYMTIIYSLCKEEQCGSTE